MLTTTLLTLSPEELKELIINAVQEVKEKRDSPVIAEEVLSRKEAAKVLKITLPTLGALTLAGHITAYKLGCNIRYKKTELMKSLIPYITDIQSKAKRA